MKQSLAPSIHESLCASWVMHIKCKTKEKKKHVLIFKRLLCFCWKRVWCLGVMSLILHLTWIWIGLWPWAVTVLRWPFPLCVRTIIPTYRHLKTSLSCPASLFHKKNDCIVAFTSYGNNFCGDLTVKKHRFRIVLALNILPVCQVFFPLRTCPCLCRMKNLSVSGVQ